jgi:hypothetical protein
MPSQYALYQKTDFSCEKKKFRNYVCISIHIFMIQRLKFVFVNVITIGLFVLCGASSTRVFRNSPVSFAMTLSVSLSIAVALSVPLFVLQIRYPPLIFPEILYLFYEKVVKNRTYCVRFWVSTCINFLVPFAVHKVGSNAKRCRHPYIRVDVSELLVLILRQSSLLHL